MPEITSKRRKVKEVSTKSKTIQPKKDISTHSK